MNADDPSTERWQRVAADLRSYRDEGRRVWGDISEDIAARYIVRACSAEERDRVERAARDHPLLRELLAIAADALVPEGEALSRTGLPSDFGKSERSSSKPPEGWSHAIAASTGDVATGPLKVTTGAGEEAGPTDWWTVRPTSDGGELFVGDPSRIRSEKGWEAVVVELPSGPRRGAILFELSDLIVVRLERSDVVSAEGV